MLLDSGFHGNDKIILYDLVVKSDQSLLFRVQREILMIMGVETRFLVTLEMTRFLNILRSHHFLFQRNRYNSVVSMKIKPNADASAIRVEPAIQRAKFGVPEMRA